MAEEKEILKIPILVHDNHDKWFRLMRIKLQGKGIGYVIECNRPYSCVTDLQPYHKLTAVVQMNHRLSKVTQGLGYTRLRLLKVTQGLGYTRLRLSKVTQGLGYRRLRLSKETSFGGEDK